MSPSVVRHVALSDGTSGIAVVLEAGTIELPARCTPWSVPSAAKTLLCRLCLQAIDPFTAAIATAGQEGNRRTLKEGLLAVGEQPLFRFPPDEVSKLMWGIPA